MALEKGGRGREGRKEGGTDGLDDGRVTGGVTCLSWRDGIDTTGFRFLLGRCEQGPRAPSPSFHALPSIYTL